MTTTTSVETARRAARRVGVILPLAIGALATVGIALMLPSMPAEVPLHWGISGPDAWGPAWVYVVWTAGFGIGIPAVYSLFFASTKRFGRIGAFLPATILGITVFITALAVGLSLLVESPLATWVPIIAAAVLGIATTFIAWQVMPKLETEERIDVPAGIPLAEGQTAVWSGTTRGWSVNAGPTGLKVRGRFG